MEEYYSFLSRKGVKQGGEVIPTEHEDGVLPSKSALIICDMWDRHWCVGATARVGELAKPIDALAKQMRALGFTIVHCPSNTMAYYADSPARKRVAAAPPADTEIPLKDWCPLDETKEAPLPFDDSDGGCFCGHGCSYSRPYYGEHPDIAIDPDRDGIGDGKDVYYFFREKGIENIFYCGVHANICVPGRPFGMRQMAEQGLNCYVVRDLIDVMYNPAMPPYIDHFDALDRMAEHLETYWGRSVLSGAFTGQRPFRFSEDYRLF